MTKRIEINLTDHLSHVSSSAIHLNKLLRNKGINPLRLSIEYDMELRYGKVEVVLSEDTKIEEIIPTKEGLYDMLIEANVKYDFCNVWTADSRASPPYIHLRR